MKKPFVMLACLGLATCLPVLSFAEEVKPLTLTEYVAQLKKKQQQEQEAQQKKLANLAATAQSQATQTSSANNLHAAASTGGVQLQVQSKVPEVVLNDVGREALSDEVKVVINANNAEIKE